MDTISDWVGDRALPLSMDIVAVRILNDTIDSLNHILDDQALSPCQLDTLAGIVNRPPAVATSYSVKILSIRLSLIDILFLSKA